MTLYFVNGSKQYKNLIETDYSDDAYDTMTGFFEDHGRFPHFLKADEEGDDLKITFESQSEFFILSGASKEEKEEFRSMML